jgi:hypothetical protein
MADRRGSGYIQVSGYVPPEVAEDFKVACIRGKIRHAEALEEAIKDWLAKRHEKQANS